MGKTSKRMDKTMQRTKGQNEETNKKNEPTSWEWGERRNEKATGVTGETNPKPGLVYTYN